jgi:hypothetical protein
MTETTAALPADGAAAGPRVASVFAVGFDFLKPFLEPHARFVGAPGEADFTLAMNCWEDPRAGWPGGCARATRSRGGRLKTRTPSRSSSRRRRPPTSSSPRTRRASRSTGAASGTRASTGSRSRARPSCTARCLRPRARPTSC